MKNTIISFGLLFLLIACNSKKVDLVYSIDKLRLIELRTVEDLFRKNNLDVIPKVSDNLKGDYKAYYVDERQSDSFSSSVVYVSRDAFGIIFLLILKNDKLISYEELAGGICAGPSEENDAVNWCSVSWTNFTSERDFYKTTVRKKSNDFINSLLQIDTVKTYFSIQKNGTIKMLKTDSTQTIKSLDGKGREK